MEKEFIPYQKALRLKELGFNESDSLGFHMLNPTDIRGDSVRLWSEYEKGDKISCNAITWQTAFRFLLKLQDEFEVYLGEDGWYIYNLENEVFLGDEALEVLINTVKNNE
jgi:hypothetical protein